MKIAIFVLLSFFSTLAMANHECSVNSMIQVYSKEPFGLKKIYKASSKWFRVTEKEHEEPFDMEIISEENEILGVAKVWTGTLLNTSEGDLIQANANVEVKGVKTDLSLLMSIDSPYAKTIFSMEVENDNELLLIPVDLRCRVKPDSSNMDF